jgi:hypothetical protein
MKRTIPLILMLLLTCGAIDAEKKYGISSHDGQLTAEITVGKHLSRSLFRDGANAHRKGSDFNRRYFGENQFDRLLIAAVSCAPDFKSRIYNRNYCG